MNRVYLPKEWLKEISIEHLKRDSTEEIQTQMSAILRKLIDLSEILLSKTDLVGMKYIFLLKPRVCHFFLQAKIYTVGYKNKRV
jgi:hypothetical protein